MLHLFHDDPVSEQISLDLLVTILNLDLQFAILTFGNTKYMYCLQKAGFVS